MEILHTNEGGYLTANKKALTLQKSQLGLNVNKHLMLTDNDLASFRIFSIISDMNKKFEKKTLLHSVDLLLNRKKIIITYPKS